MPNQNNSRFSIPSAFEGGRNAKGAMPVLFQVLAPDLNTPLLPDYLYLHVNPQNLDFSYSQNVNRVQTKGGFVEQHFGKELTDISASGSTGAFVSVENGVTTYDRRNTIAHRKIKQLLDVYKNNGSVYDDKGNVQFRGRIRLLFGGGIYDGYFTSFNENETAEQPFSFTVDWSFKAQKERYTFVY